MKTGLWLSLILLVVLLAGGVMMENATSSLSDRYVSAAEELRILVSQQQWQRAEETASAYLESWEKTKNWVQTLIDHEDTDAISIALERILAGINNRDVSICLVFCTDLQESAHHLHHRSAFTLANVL